jgi:hypothetical protein
VQILATVPDGMAIKSAAGPRSFTIRGQQITFEPVPKLVARANCVFRVKVIGKQPGDWRFKVQMKCDQLRTPVNKEKSTQVYAD